MDSVNLIFLSLILAYSAGFCWYLVCLKKYEPDAWEEMGRPAFFNGSGISSVMYVVLGSYKKSSSKALKRACFFLRLILTVTTVAGLVYFLVPLEVWYG